MSFQDHDLLVKLAQIVGIVMSAYASGFISSFTIAGVPAVMTPACPIPLATKIWKKMYDIGHIVGPTVAFTACGAHAYVAWSSTGRTAIAYWIAAALSIGIHPYTLAVMVPTNEKLIAFAAGQGKLKGVEDAHVQGLMRKWAWMNAVRSALPATGAAIALATALHLWV